MKKKKAVMTFDMLMHLPRIFFLLLVGGLIAYIVWSFITFNTDTRYQESHVLVNNILYSNEGISYRDLETNRLYPGVIDITKFNEYTMEKVFIHPNNNFVAIQVILQDLEEPHIIDDKIYLNEGNYKLFLSSARTKAEGAGGASEYNFIRYVLIKMEESYGQAMINITIVMPNE